MRALIIGAGEIGRALGFALSGAGHVSWFWDRNLSKRTPGRDLKQMGGECDFVFFCVPSTGLREAAMEIRGCVAPGKPLFVLTKGLEFGSYKTSEEVLKDIFPDNPSIVFGGPMLAGEILSGKEALGVFGSEDEKSLLSARELFKGTGIIIETTGDAKGLALCGTLKNIYALAFGFAESVGEESNIKGLLASEALKEMLGIVSILGGKPETVLGPGGLGDLIASGMSCFGCNRRVGKEILEKGRSSLVSEGALSIGPIAALLGEKTDKFPLFMVIQNILLHPDSGKELFKKYIISIN